MKYQLPVYVLLERPRWPFVLCSFAIFLGFLFIIALLIASHGIPFLLLAPLGYALLSSLGAGGSFVLSASLMLAGALGLNAEIIQPDTVRQFFKKLGLAALNLITLGFFRHKLYPKQEIVLAPEVKVDSAKIMYVLPTGKHREVTFLKDPAKGPRLFFAKEVENSPVTPSTSEIDEFIKTHKEEEYQL